MSGTITITIDEVGTLKMQVQGLDPARALLALELAKGKTLELASAPRSPIISAVAVPRINGRG